ncbi:MAG TPA: ComF family protein, partial [Pilimelia sp.]|nr:ComF family protein [Pilimelia sp.]
MTAATWAARVAADLRDLLLPGGCAGCGAAGPLRWHTCPDCAAECAGVPREVRPRPAPPGLPPVTAATAYAGAARRLLLAYKERGAHQLAVPLGGLLAGAVRLAAPGPAPIVVVPVPSTAAAARERYGDHMARLTRQAVRRLRSAGVPATAVRPLRMRRRPDSAGLDAAR